jgi:hypothetical protein
MQRTRFLRIALGLACAAALAMPVVGSAVLRAGPRHGARPRSRARGPAAPACGPVPRRGAPV